jgi:hypothetical protein
LVMQEVACTMIGEKKQDVKESVRWSYMHGH